MYDEIADWPLDHDADPNSPGSTGYTALSAAVQYGSISAIFRLMDYGADLQRGHILHQAIRPKPRWLQILQRPEHDWLALLDWLIASGLSVDTRIPRTESYRRTSTLSTPLQEAVEQGNMDAITYLLDMGADPNAKNGEGLTALGWALRNPYTLNVKMMKNAIKNRSRAAVLSA